MFKELKKSEKTLMAIHTISSIFIYFYEKTKSDFYSMQLKEHSVIKYKSPSLWAIFQTLLKLTAASQDP